MKIPLARRKTLASTKAATGKRAEVAALKFLRGEGLQLVDRNFRCRLGEVDLVMLDHGCLAFVEVRYRSERSFTSAALSVTGQKQTRIALTAEFFLCKNPMLSDHPVRFDVVAFDGAETGPSRIQWIRDAFRV